MYSRKQVIERLDHLARYAALGDEWRQALADAIQMLTEPVKEESIAPRWIVGTKKEAYCSECFSCLYDWSWTYCPRCGKKVKWDK